MVLLLCAVFLLVSCGEKTAELTTETEVVAEQPVLGEEGAIVEETVVIDSGDESVAVDVSTEEAEVSVDVISDEVADSIEAEATTPTEVEIKIENYAYDEKTVTVKAGTTVVWENYDSAPHTVTGDGLDSGKMSKGDVYSYTFTEAGTYEYICTYHPSMKGKVVVE